MDTRCIILTLNIFLILLITVTTSLAGKQRKRQDFKPHAGHVAGDRTSLKSLTRDALPLNSITNTVSTEESELYQKLRTHNKRFTVRNIRRLIYKKKRILNGKKRKRRLRRLRKELAILKRVARLHKKKCKSSKDCGRNECCLKFNQRGYGRCKKRPKLKQRCRPALLPGIDTECPCRYGLTCAPFKRRRKSGHYKFRCETIRYTDEEFEAHSITGLGRYKK